MKLSPSPRRPIASWIFSAAVVLAAGPLLEGCAYYTRPGSHPPATATVAPADRQRVWARAVSALLDQGYVPQVLNESAGYISAKRRDDIANDALTGTLATVVVSPEGAVRVELSGIGLFTSEQAFLDAVATRQGQIMAAVMAGAAPGK